MTILHIALWFAAMTLLAFALMFFDKRAAENGGWRVPERTLLLWAFLGGAIGAKLAQSRFRHKTRKQPFGTLLNLALAINAAQAVLLLIPASRDRVLDVLLDLI
jgi:uncharacterized membrane protein YsdA (DUF1294 family)